MSLTVGQRLHIARESKGLSLQDVAHSTRIPVPRLRDLEQDTYTTFGSLTYARSFLQDYSKLMGVDAHEVLEEMHTPPLGGTPDYKYLLQSFGTWTRKGSRDAAAPAMARGRSFGMVAGICAALLVFGMGILLGSAILGGDHKAPSKGQGAPLEEVRSARPAPLPETQSPSFAAPVALPPPVEAQPAAPFKRPNVAPGTILKALPVEEPKNTKAKR